MCGGIILGIVGAALATKLLFRWRMHRRWGGGCGHGGHGCGGGWGHGRWGDHGHGFGGWRGRGGPMRLMDELELNQRQREEVKEVFDKVREAASQQGFGNLRDKLSSLLGAVGGESFDRAKVEAAIGAEGDKLQALKKEILDGIEHVHNILTPEQREKLRAILARFTSGGYGRRWGGPPSGEASL